MARIEKDREDLMIEAVAFVRRAEWKFADSDFCSILFTGYKRNGAFSLYLDADPVYQFDANGKLRRAFVDGLIYRTEGKTLARMKRKRTEEESILLRHDLSNKELDLFFHEMKLTLSNLKTEFESQTVELISEINSGSDMRESIIASLTQILSLKTPLAESM